jgi:hypothetical protein
MINILDKPKTKHIRKVKLVKTVCFKCKECGETDRDLAERYCGNPECKYRR